MSATPSVLIVTYVWPPTGGVGAQRVLKLAKYLPEFGVRPVIVTVSNPSVPLVDASLVHEVPPGVEVLYARTLEPGYAAKRVFWDQERTDRRGLGGTVRRAMTGLARQCLVPDPQILWQPDLLRVLRRRLRERRDQAVIFTGPPFSPFLAAPIVRRFRDVRVVLDYRDEWHTLRTQYEMLSRLGAGVGHTLEQGVLRAAHTVTVATDAFREHLLARFRFLDPARVVTIVNGFDPDDVPAELRMRSTPPADRFVLTYAGTVFRQNSPQGLIGALRRLHAREPELARRLSVQVYGRIVETELPWFEGSEALGVERFGFRERPDVLAALTGSHQTLCLLDDMPGAERIYPGKIFELMGVGRPILTLAPDGVLSDLVTRHQLGPVLRPRDEAGIAQLLESQLREWSAGRWSLDAPGVGTEIYHRRETAARFARVVTGAQG